MVLNVQKELRDLETLKTSFNNIKNRMIQHYPNFENTNEKSGFLNAKKAMEKLFNSLTIKEIQINGEIKNNNRIINTKNINIGSSKLKFTNNKKNLNNKLRVNNASETLKIDKYNENVKIYLQTFFYIYTIYLMVRYIKH
jgi:hypothetical protein